MPDCNGPMCSRGLSLDTPIYRIHRYRHLENLLAGKLILPTTRKWDDPYENLISWCAYEFIGAMGKIEQVFVGEGRMPTFGQCWTTIPESDAMWRIYSDVDKHRELNSSFSVNEGVRLRTTARKLVKALATGMGESRSQNCYVGRVKYMEEEELRTYFANAIGTYRDQAFSGVPGHADALSVKRSPFAHENEVRLLYIDALREFQNLEFIEAQIDANAVFDEIMLDPRIRSGGGGEPERTQWIKDRGFKNTITASELYHKCLMLVPLFKPEDLQQLPKPQNDRA